MIFAEPAENDTMEMDHAPCCSPLSFQPQQRHSTNLRKMVRNNVMQIEHDFHKIVRKSPFLQHAIATLPQRQEQQCIAFFHRSEIVTARTPLGKGGFAEVYEITGFVLQRWVSQRLTWRQQQIRQHFVETALDYNGNGRYVIKQLQPSLLDSSPAEFRCAVTDLAVEGTYMSALDHPNILSTRGLPVDGLQALNDGRHDSYFIVTDRLLATLEERIEEWNAGTESVSLCTKASLALQLAEAIEYLHQRRIVFRDLKSSNVGFAPDGTVMLFDFGLARQLPHPTNSNANVMCEEVYEMSGVGTRRYMAPEVIVDGRYNCGADVYSWSMVFWEMLMQSKPYEDYSLNQHRLKVCQGGERPLVFSCWPAALRNLLQQSWTACVRSRLTMTDVCYLVQSMSQPIGGWRTDSTHTSSLSMSSPTGVMEHDTMYAAAANAQYCQAYGGPPCYVQLKSTEPWVEPMSDDDLWSCAGDLDTSLLLTGPIISDDNSFHHHQRAGRGALDCYHM